MTNEKRLIDDFRNEIMGEFIEQCQGNDFNRLTLLEIGETIDRIYRKYSTLPTVDAVEVVHGRWEPHSRYPGFDRCSACCNCIIGDDWADGEKWNYCPNCGAKMDGGTSP